MSCVRLPLLMRALPEENPETHGALPRCSDSGWCLPPEFNLFDTICRELSELKIFFFLIAKHNGLCQQTMKGLSWQTVRSVSFSWSRGLLAYGTDGTVSRGVGCDVERAAPLSGGGGRYSLELICMGLSAVPEPSCLAARWFRWPRRLYQNSIKMIHSLSFVPVLPAVFSGALKCCGL